MRRPAKSLLAALGGAALLPLSATAAAADPDFMPLVSDNWNNLFTWTGVGEMPQEERARLHEFVRAAHL
ncbi:hypothetical protein GTR00_10015, partial [Kineococcus sp. T90]|nr:hypothetical protein [Kineococcus indalonis]